MRRQEGLEETTIKGSIFAAYIINQFTINLKIHRRQSHGMVYLNPQTRILVGMGEVKYKPGINDHSWPPICN
jgi:hypothetical protein